MDARCHRLDGLVAVALIAAARDWLVFDLTKEILEATHSLIRISSVGPFQWRVR